MPAMTRPLPRRRHEPALRRSAELERMSETEVADTLLTALENIASSIMDVACCFAELRRRGKSTDGYGFSPRNVSLLLLVASGELLPEAYVAFSDFGNNSLFRISRYSIQDQERILKGPIPIAVRRNGIWTTVQRYFRDMDREDMSRALDDDHIRDEMEQRAWVERCEATIASPARAPREIAGAVVDDEKREITFSGTYPIEKAEQIIQEAKKPAGAKTAELVLKGLTPKQKKTIERHAQREKLTVTEVVLESLRQTGVFDA